MVESKKASSSKDAKGKPRLSQRSLLDMFPKKQNAKTNLEKEVEKLQSEVDETPEFEPTNSTKAPPSPDIISISSSDHPPEVIDIEDTSSEVSEPPNTSSPLIEIDDLTEDEGLTGTHKDDPIILTDSPTKPSKGLARSASSSKALKPTYSIFAPRLPKSISLPVTPPSPTKTTRGMGAPLPDGSCQHVRGPQSTFSTPRSPFNTRQPYHSTTDDSVSLKSIILPSTPKSTPSVGFQKPNSLDIPVEHQQSHPVIAQVVSLSGSDSDSHKLWTDKWHPTRADHVLGNEEQALYLRDWLWALQVQLQDVSTQPSTRKEKRGSKRRRIVRAVDKKKKRRIEDDDDNWIVYSDEIQDYEEEEEVAVKRPRLYRQSSHDNALDSHSSEKPKTPIRHTFKDRLTNTILLTGGHGVGKTAAVYACAEELEWDVFEVYPGIGRRNGANLDSLVGEVGKNHLVQKKGPLRAMLSKGIPEDCQSLSDEKTVGQSCILLEEVDILYKEDVNFWPTVVNIIKECRRPVILTCNDVSLIPIEDLPLQNVLNFEPCAASVGLSYLQAICYAQGYAMAREAVSQLQEPGDLRRSIHSAQLWCCGSDDGRVPGTTSSDDLEQEGSGDAELMSFADCYLLRNRMDTDEETKPSMDEVVGYPSLGMAEWSVGDREEEMASAMGCSRGDGQELLQARVRYEKMLKEFCNNVAVGGSEILRQLEYFAWIREMVAADDAAEAAMERAGGRTTRNSQRYVRTVGLDTNMRRFLESSRYLVI